MRHSILGSLEDFESERRARAEAAQAAGVPLESSGTSLLHNAFGNSVGAAPGSMAPSRASTAASQFRKVATASAWVSDAEREQIRSQRAIQRAEFYKREHRRNEEQAAKTTGKASIMHLASAHRDKVLAKQDEQVEKQRQMGEALPAAWAIALRDAGQEVVRVGPALNNIFAINNGGLVKIKRRPPPALLAGVESSAGQAMTEVASGTAQLTDSTQLLPSERDFAGASAESDVALRKQAEASAASLGESMGSRADSAPAGLRGAEHGHRPATSMLGSSLGMASSIGIGTKALASVGSKAGEQRLQQPSQLLGPLPSSLRPATAMAYARGTLPAAPLPAPAAAAQEEDGLPRYAQPSVAVELSSTLLALDARPGHASTGIISLRNCGSSAIHFSWQRMRAERQQQLHDNLPTRADAARFHVAPALGALAPDSAMEVTFSFSTQLTGRFVDAFELLLAPDVRQSADEELPTVRLVARCTEPVNAAAVGRRRVQATIAHSVLHAMMVDILVADVLARIPRPPPPPVVTNGGVAGVAERKSAAEWARANGLHQLHYHHERATELLSIGEAARAVLPAVDVAGGLDLLALHAALASASEPRPSEHALPAEEEDTMSVRAQSSAAALQRAALTARLDSLYAQASMPPLLEARQALVGAVYTSLCQLAEAMEEVAHARAAMGEKAAHGSRRPVAGTDQAGVADGVEAPSEAEAAGAPEVLAEATVRMADEPLGPSQSLQPPRPEDWRLDTDWVGTRAIDTPAAALCIARQKHALSPPTGSSSMPPSAVAAAFSASNPPDPAGKAARNRAAAKRLYVPAGGKAVALMPEPFSPPDTPRAGTLALSSPWAMRLSPQPGTSGTQQPANGKAAKDEEEARGARAHLTSAVRELLLGLADKIALQVRPRAGCGGQGLARGCDLSAAIGLVCPVRTAPLRNSLNASWPSLHASSSAACMFTRAHCQHPPPRECPYSPSTRPHVYCLLPLAAGS